MGIKNLIKVIERYAPNAIKKTKIDKYNNKTIGIDFSLMLYKMIYAIRKNGYDLKKGDKIVTHIHALLLKMKGFIRHKIIPVFIFDGIAPGIKKETLKKRSEFQKVMQMKYYKAVTQDEKKKYYFMASKISYQEIKDCMELIQLFGYTIVIAPEEADSQLADLIKKDKIDYIATDDMDIIVFGGTKVLKNFTINKTRYIQEIDLKRFLKDASLTQEQLIDIALMNGCDYCPSMQGIGPIKSYNFIKQYGTIEKTIQKEGIKLTYDIDKAKKYFKDAPIIDSKNIQINKLKVNKDGLKQFLEKFGYEKDYIYNLLSDISK